MEPHELENYERILGWDGVLTGHIDLIRFHDGKVWIWDYKPDAAYEKQADEQVFLYALMLSKRTGLGLHRFHCGYFDQFYSFTFNPIHMEPIAK